MEDFKVALSAVLLILMVVLLSLTIRNQQKAEALEDRIDAFRIELEAQLDANQDFCESAEAICQKALEVCSSNPN